MSGARTNFISTLIKYIQQFKKERKALYPMEKAPTVIREITPFCKE